MDTSNQPHLDTVLAQAGHYLDSSTGAVTPPIHTSSTYARDAHYRPTQAGLTYSRDGNPTYAQAEKVIATLETGADALLFGSGLAAATAAFKFVRPGEHIVAPRQMYHGLRDWLQHFCEHYGIGLTLFDAGDPDALSAALLPGQSRLVWIETPANPTWTVTDIAAAARAAHDAGAFLAVDSTVATPLLTRPLELGADLVFHSATKYFNGHSDVVAGILVCREQNDWWETIRFARKHDGAVAGPFEAWLLLRGMRTLHLRVCRAVESAERIARHFQSHPRVETVLYPGLSDFPGHSIAKRQMSGGFGAVLSLLVNGDADYARKVCASTKVWIPGTSLGGVESLIEHRATVEGPASPVPPNLVRLSVGVECVDDLIADLGNALTAARDTDHA